MDNEKDWKTSRSLIRFVEIYSARYKSDECDSRVFDLVNLIIFRPSFLIVNVIDQKKRECDKWTNEIACFQARILFAFQTFNDTLKSAR